MAIPSTPAEWLPVLAYRLDMRYARVVRLRGYANGEAPLPEMGPNTRASWIAFQRKARTDFGGLAVRSLANRLHPNGVRIGTSEDDPALATVRRIMRDNRWDVQVNSAIYDYLETGVGYLVSGLGDEGAVITSEKPEQFYASPDPLRPWKARASLKVWRDLDAKTDYAVVICAGQQQVFTRPSYNTQNVLVTGAGFGWTPMGNPVAFQGQPPVAILARRDSAVTGEPAALVEPHTDLIDRINTGKLHRLTTTAMQAFRQRALRPPAGGEPLPDKDPDGNDIDWSKILEPAPGALWDFPVPIDIWESQPTDINPMLAGEKQDAREFAAVTGTPVYVLLPDSANEAAGSSEKQVEQQVFQAHEEINRLVPGLQVALVYALRAEGVDLGDRTLEVLFEDPEHVSLSEKYAAAVQAKGAGLAGRTIKRDILGMSPDQIKQDEADQASDQLAAALMTVGAPQQPAPQQQGPTGGPQPTAA